MYRTGDGSYSTYMCGQCQFGPIDHGWCNNLSTHHGEEKSNNTSASETTPRSVVNNSCPKCGWFADDIGAWPKWDGTFHEEPARDNEEEEGASSGQENLDNDNTDNEAPAPDTEQEEGTGSGQDNLNNENAGEGNHQAQPVESALLWLRKFRERKRRQGQSPSTTDCVHLCANRWSQLLVITRPPALRQGIKNITISSGISWRVKK